MSDGAIHGRQQRRLTTILAADVAGYSRMMSGDEEAALRTLKAHREVVDALIARHDGRIFNTAGDSVVAEFSSAVEAVRCAITIQDELRVRNAELDEGRRMLFRIGINVGDVLVDGTNLYGDGVNVAARLEGIAQPGGICISGSVFALVKNKLSYSFEDMGPQTVKNIPEPVPAFRLTLGMAALGTADVAVPVAAAARRKRAIVPLAVSAAVVAVGAAAAIYWLVPGNVDVAIAPGAAAPLGAATPASGEPPLDKAALERMQPYVGMKVRGTSRVTGRLFIMELNAGGNAVVQVELASGGKLNPDHGRWWIPPNGALCMNFHRFANGSPYCRPLTVEDGVLKAYTWNRDPDFWTLSK